MKRADLKAKLEGVENAAEIIDFIMSENGKDISAAQKAAGDAETELSAYRKGGDKYLDPAKFEAFKAFDPTRFADYDELKKFKADTETREVRGKKESALTEALKSSKASEKALKLLIRGVDLDKIELDDKGAIKDADKIIEPLKADYADYFTTETTGGAQPGNPAPSGGSNDPFLAGFKGAKT